MGLSWLVLMIELLILIIIKPGRGNLELLTIIMVGINLFFVIIDFRKYNKKMALILYSGYVARLLAMLWDIYAKNIFLFPGSGGDSERFLSTAIRITQNINLLSQEIYGDYYTKLLGIIFYSTGVERMIGQYINVLLGVSIIITLYIILKTLNISEKTIYIAITLLAFFPNAIVMSAILLRENLIVLFLLLSFLFFVKWYQNGGVLNIALSTLFLLLSSSFHAGVIGIGVGYAGMYLFYRRKEKRIAFDRNTLIYFMFFIIFAGYIFLNYSDVFLAKFSNINGIADLYRELSTGRGGSQYLKAVQVDSPLDFVIYLPIKMLFFLISPFPTDWRGLQDILAFMLDSILYIYMISYALKNFRGTEKKPILLGLTVSLLAFVFIFAIGVSNAGTAMRHRHKILPLFLVYYAMLSDWRIVKGRA